MERISGWTLFTLRGVEIKLHVSLLFLLFYVMLIAIAQFPFVIEASDVNPNQIIGSPFSWALIFSLSLVISIFLHEFGHVLMAQAEGYKVRAITLMMLGGVSQIEKVPEEPLVEFKVALIGPLVSLGIAGILFWIRSFSDSANIDFFCYWIGQTNLILGIFNLLPAFPMDGGRVLRSFLVIRQGRLKGTETAVQVSRVFAWILGIIGFLQFNFLLMLIAFFIYAMAKSELFVLVGQTLLKRMKAKDLLISLPSLPETSTISEAIAIMASSKTLILPVTRDTGPPSMLSADLLKRIPKHLWKSTSIKDIAVQIPKIIHPDDSLDEVFLLALKTVAGGLPVVDGHQLIGVIRTTDLLETLELLQLTTEQATAPWTLKIRQLPSN